LMSGPPWRETLGFAGLTLVDNVANLIVSEAARGKASLNCMGYLRVGLLITLVSFVLGLAVLLAEHALS
jgi:Na+/H+ antiporter NhaD/arsenite permease-like protein